MVTPPAIHFANDRFAAESFADVISAETLQMSASRHAPACCTWS